MNGDITKNLGDKRPFEDRVFARFDAFDDRFASIDARFNQILIFGLLHHLPDTGVRGVLSECRRLLAPGGRVLVIEDIPAVSRLNLVGHLIHRVENGEFIRPVEDYRRLYAEAGRVERELVMQSGICDYYAAVLVTT